MSKTQLKKMLTGMSNDEIISVVLELYSARQEAKDYLDYLMAPDEQGELEKFKKIVVKEFDDTNTAQCRFSVCRKALSDFKKLSPSTDVLAEAMVFYVEQVCRFSFYNGDLWDQYYNSALSNFEAMMNFLVKNNLLETMMPRVVQILAWCSPCGYGFFNDIEDIFCKLAPSQYHDNVEKAIAIGKEQYRW